MPELSRELPRLVEKTAAEEEKQEEEEEEETAVGGSVEGKAG